MISLPWRTYFNHVNLGHAVQLVFASDGFTATSQVVRQQKSSWRKAKTVASLSGQALANRVTTFSMQGTASATFVCSVCAAVVEASRNWRGNCNGLRFCCSIRGSLFYFHLCIVTLTGRFMVIIKCKTFLSESVVFLFLYFSDVKIVSPTS